MAGLTAIKRKGFAGGGKDASTSSFDKGATSKGPNPSREDRVSHGATQFQADNQGFTPTQVANQNAGTLTGADYTDASNAYKIGVHQPKEIPAFIPGGMYFKMLRGALGTPKTKMGKMSIAKKRMNYINSLDPRSRKAMMDRLGLFEDDDYETQEQYLTAMGKNLYGIDSLDIINYDGEYMKKYGPKPIENIGGDGDQTILPYPYNPINDEDAEDAEEITFDYRLGDPNANQAADVTQGFYAATGGRVPRAFGGIMDSATGRKAYGLGSVFKSITKPFKGIAKAAGKVLSSDVGKMAIAGLGAYYLGGGKNLGGAKFFGNTGFGKTNFLSNLGAIKDYVVDNPFKSIGIASTVLPFIPGINEAKQDPSLMATRKDTGLIDPLTGDEGTPASMRANIENAKIEAGDDPVKLAALNAKYNNMLFSNLPYENYGTYAQGGRIRAEEGGLMNLGGMEKDYRAEGGFVPIGKAEKADDVPARLSVNEFVFTADAVRNAGGGDIDKGAEVMENMMKNLENGGRVSEESQGNTGAQDMFSVSERIGEVI